MPIFITEREIPDADKLSPDELRQLSSIRVEIAEGAPLPYRWIASYVATNKIYCIHEADTPYLILRHARLGGFPANVIARIESVVGPVSACADARAA